MIREILTGVFGLVRGLRFTARQGRPTLQRAGEAELYFDARTNAFRYTTAAGDSALGGSSGGTSDHTALSNLAWPSSGHTGTASRVAAFDGGGAASYLQVGVDLQAYSSSLAAIAGGTWTGAASITTLGTIGTGVWQGTTVGVGYGGTGLTSYTVGDILYASGTTTLAKLAAGTSGYVLSTNGAGTAPTWISLPAALYPTQQITGSTGTITSGKRWVELTHASPTITLPAVYSAGISLEVAGPTTSGAYAFIVCAGSDTFDTGAVGVRVSGAGYKLRMVSNGTSWEVQAVLGVCELPIVNIDLTGITGSSPWTVTDSLSGGSLTLTDRSALSTASSASSGLRLAPSSATGVWGSGTGTAASLDLSALGITIEDEFAIVGLYSMAIGPATGRAVSLVVGTTLAATKAGTQHQESNPDSTLRWGSTTTIITNGAMSSPTAIGVHVLGRDRQVRALGGAPSGTFSTAWSPLQLGSPGGTSYVLVDPNLATASQADWLAAFTRMLVAASNTTAAEAWTFTRIVVVRILRGGR